jgi:hypothetical protein
MFKILLSKYNILNIELDKEQGGGRMGWTGGSIRGDKDTHLRHGWWRRWKEQGTATKMSKILLGLSNILNITKENSGV